eukprot:scaffold69720_cov36-Phaeocystis_antarctica.AAC.2
MHTRRARDDENVTSGVHNALLQLAPPLTGAALRGAALGPPPPAAMLSQSPRSSRTPPPPPPPPSSSVAPDGESVAQPALVCMLLDGTLPELLRSAVGDSSLVAEASGLQRGAPAPLGCACTPPPPPPSFVLERMLGQARMMENGEEGREEAARTRECEA